MTTPQQPAQEAFGRLLQIMDELREQCPWDKKQTWESLRHLTIEETFELADAIIENDAQEVKKEAGDIMLHLVFYARIAAEKGYWDVTQMIHALCDKLVARHPHIYGDVTVADEDEVKRNWEALKLKEKSADEKPKGVLSGVPKGMPAMVKAMRIQEKARGAGFDWDEPAQVWEKVQEELGELLDAARAGQEEEVKKEFGDVLFSLINYARFIGVNPEEALERTNRKFIYRFNYMEDRVRELGKELREMTLPEMDEYWNEAKAIERGQTPPNA
jgi:XTP/dITP diphosphohydrolase